MYMDRSGPIRIGVRVVLVLGVAGALWCPATRADNGVSDPCEPALDVVFAIDDTASMGPAIQDIQDALEDILDRITVKSGGNYKMGLCTFKDTVQMDV